MAERRRATRIPEKTQVVVSVFSAPGAPDLEHRTFFCSSADLSASGVQLVVPHAVPAGSRVMLSVAMVHPPVAFRHAGRVVWCRADEKTRKWTIGIEITRTLDKRASIWLNAIRGKIDRRIVAQ